MHLSRMSSMGGSLAVIDETVSLRPMKDEIKSDRAPLDLGLSLVNTALKTLSNLISRGLNESLNLKLVSILSILHSDAGRFDFEENILRINKNGTRYQIKLGCCYLHNISPQSVTELAPIPD